MAEEETEEKETENTEANRGFPTGVPSEHSLVAEHLQRMPSIFSRGLLYLLILVLIVSLVYAIVSRIDIIVEGKSIVQPTSHKIKVLSDRDGYIERVFIAEGQAVKENDPLYLLRSKETLTFRSKADELKISIPLKKEYFDTKISSLRDELNSAESDIMFWRTEVANLSKEFDDMKALFEKRLASIGEYNSIKSRLERARTELEKLFNKKKILGKEIRNKELEKATTLQSMHGELEKNERMLSIKDNSFLHQGAEKERDNYIQAENAGIVSELYFRNAGEFVRMSDLLCTIVPADGSFYMDIVVANKDIGFIEPGVEIKYKIDAFPYTDYGILKGKVVAVSPSAVEDRTQGFVYHVRGSLAKTFFEIRGRKYDIKPGMTATAELVTEKKSIFSLLFKKLKNKP